MDQNVKKKVNVPGAPAAANAAMAARINDQPMAQQRAQPGNVGFPVYGGVSAQQRAQPFEFGRPQVCEIFYFIFTHKCVRPGAIVVAY